MGGKRFSWFVWGAALLSLNPTSAWANGYDIFDGNDLVAFKGGKVTERNSKIGSSSLLWDTGKTRQLDIIFREPVKVRKRNTLHFWIYKEKACGQPFQIEVIGGKRITRPVHLFQRGWSSFAALYTRDMGFSEGDTIKGFRLKAPKANGNLYLDFVAPSFEHPETKGPSFLAASLVTPWVGGARVNHWVNYYEPWVCEIPEQFKNIRSGKAELEQHKKTVARLLGSPKKRQSIQAMRNILKRYNIRREGGIMRGDFIRHNGATSIMMKGGHGVKEVLQDINELAAHAYHLNSEEVDRLYFDAVEYFLEQGWGAGEIGEPFAHHLGYSMRAWPGAITAMYLRLSKTGREKRLKPLIDGYKWYSKFRKLRMQGDINFDTINTELPGIFQMALLGDPVQSRTNLKMFSAWLSQKSFSQIRDDGTPHHHGMYITGYVREPSRRMMQMFYQLKQLGVPVSGEAYHYFKEALKQTIHVQTVTGGVLPDHQDGRAVMHASKPNGSHILPYLEKAIYAGPEPVDRELAAYYLALAKPGDEEYDKFQAMGIAPYRLTGRNYTYPHMGGVFTHKAKDPEVHVSISSMNQEQRGVEIYGWVNDAANIYSSRYCKNGSMFVFHHGRSSFLSSYDGWNHYYWPGATSSVPDNEDQQQLYLYYGKVDSKSWAGGAALDSAGVWGMDLKNWVEGQKSVFFVDGMAIALGSGLSKGKFGNVVTTLFQEKVNETGSLSGSFGTLTGGQDRRFEEDRAWLIDQHGTGYLIPKMHDNELVVQRRTQRYHYCITRDAKEPLKSTWNPKKHRKQAGMVNEAFAREHFKPQSGFFNLCYLKHQSGNYQYVVLPKATTGKMEAVRKSFAQGAPYRVLAQDASTHAIYHQQARFLGVACFPSDQNRRPRSFQLAGEGIELTMQTAGYLACQLVDDEIHLAVSTLDDIEHFDLSFQGLNKDEWELKSSHLNSLLSVGKMTREIRVSGNTKAVRLRVPRIHAGNHYLVLKAVSK